MIIRRRPEDFQVTEQPSQALRAALAPRWSSANAHAAYELRKTSLTTPEAIARLAKSLGIRPGVISYAGLKDKHAVTTQWVTLPVPSISAAAALPPQAGAANWSANLIGFAPQPLAAAQIDANHFTIVIRRMQRRDFGLMQDRARLLTAPAGPDHPASLLVVNYFGEQRFGSARHAPPGGGAGGAGGGGGGGREGEGFAAAHLVRAEFEQALKLLIATPARKDSGPWRTFTRLCATHWGDWNLLLEKLPRRAECAPIEALAAGRSMRDAFAALPFFTQTMCVEAFQSHLWNRTAYALVHQITPKPFEADTDAGPAAFPPARDVDPAWESLRVPMLAPDTRLHEPWARHATQALANQGLTQQQLVIPGLRRPAFGEADRPLFIRAESFELVTPEPDELSTGSALFKRTVSFTLPRGAYATVVLHALGV